MPATNRTVPAQGPQDPVIDFYSDQPGSGGNVTWDVTLPVDHNATANQSDLYEAVEFGMVVTDPYGWMDQCFLQVQFYPDATWYGSGSDNGNWIGAVIGWQIQALTGVEDPCYYSPLYAGTDVPGSGFLNLTQGDRINVTMKGWPGSSAGELVTVKDVTHTGNQSFATAFNTTGSYPLDPVYSYNNVPDALQWGTGGDLPVTFSLLTGRGDNPTIPDNNSYGGCSPGLPPSTSANPAVPCPSYDPGSWINDTLHPWQIDPPTFFNASARSGPPAQVSFSQAYGGLDEVSAGSAACSGRLGSAYCSYPWFSYTCGTDAFEFGATDFPGVSDDFGKYDQYSASPAYNPAELPFYPALSYSVPTCGNSDYTLTVAPDTTGGSVEFLSHSYDTQATLSDLSLGAYEVAATPPTGEYFADWMTTGGVSVTAEFSPFTSVTLSGNGSLIADYSATPTEVAVTFDDSPSGEIAVSPEPILNTEGTVKTVPAGQEVDLTPGVYTILAYPPQGFEFADWGPSSTGVVIPASELPMTYLVVTGNSATGSVVATYTASSQRDAITIEAFDPANSTLGGGEVSLGTLATHTKTDSGSIGMGTFNLTATPFAGYSFGGWLYSPSSIMLNFSSKTNITLENGTTNATTHVGFVAAIFNPDPVLVTFSALGESGGVVISGFGYVPSGSSLNLIPGENYTASAAPNGSSRFVSWGPRFSTTVWNRASGSWTEQLVANASGTVSVTYGPGVDETITFHVTPVAGGEIDFNGDETYSNGTSNTSVAFGETYLDGVTIAAGYTFSRWSASGLIAVGAANSANSTVTVSGSGDLNVTLVPFTVPVTFLVAPAQFGTLELEGSPIANGSTVLLAPSSYTISVNTSATGTFDSWSASANLAVATPETNGTTFTVNGPATLTALVTPFTVSAPTVSPDPVDTGVSVEFQSTAPGGGSFAGFTAEWSGLPAGCTADSTEDSFSCSPDAAGRYFVAVSFTDSWGEPATSAASFLRVNPLPTLTGPIASFAAVDVGVATNLSAIVNGGTHPFSWSYTNLPNGCTTVDADALICSPSEVGSFNVSVMVTDKFGNTASGVVQLEVNPLPSVKISASTTSPTTGNHLTITTVVLGGTGPFTYNYVGLPTGCPGTTAASFSCVPTTAGTYHVNVTAADIFGKSANQILTLVVSKPTPSIFGLESVEIGIGVLLLVVIALVVFLALRRRPKKPTASAPPPVVVPAPLPKITRPAPRPPLPEWSEEPPPPKEWQEGQ